MGYYVDGAWNCGCGANNAVYLKECGKCGAKKEEVK
jgi:hypothetical protein